ncbi:MAG: hypothetical protein AAFV77_01890 [Planctomycetota bacterium]
MTASTEATELKPSPQTPDSRTMAAQLDPTPLIIALAVLGIAAMLLTMAAAIRQGTSVLDLEVKVQRLREMQRQQLIAKGAIAADPHEVFGVDIIEDDDVIEIAEAAEVGDNASPISGEPEIEPARQAA